MTDIANLEAMLTALLEAQGDSSANDVGTMADDDLAVHALSNRFAGNLTFSKQRGWAYFPRDAHRWVADRDGFGIVAEVQTMLRELRRNETDQRRSQYLGSKTRRDAVVDMLKGLPETRFSGEWDANTDLLAVPNGVVNLRTGELLDGDPDQRITRAATVPYDPDAECPRWERFIEEIFPNDPDMPAYIQRLLGYGITGRTSEQCFAVLYGAGSNGKSVLLTVLRKILGEHAATVPFDMFTTTGAKRGGPDAELLVGARMALASETNRSAVLDSAAIKNATGGEEVNVNPKYRDPYSFNPQALILLATNYKPSVKEQDTGTWRRIKLIPFNRYFSPDERDDNLHDTLAAEYAGILAWLVRGAMDWYRTGLDDPASVRKAVDAYKDESDTLAGFFPGAYVLAPGKRVFVSEVWTDYEEWADIEGIDPYRQSSTLSKAIQERSGGEVISTRGAKGKAVLVGIRKVSEQERADGPGIFAAD
ncbi:phage/plasmid primase, P4 family [Streptomyces sp. NBC_01602]|uniref:DNA primase family protein n=1 Tax=Streptomyces sp. NBC_01602 TaxID=2975893 RepID=UPI00386FF3B5